MVAFLFGARLLLVALALHRLRHPPTNLAAVAMVGVRRLRKHCSRVVHEADVTTECGSSGVVSDYAG